MTLVLSKLYGVEPEIESKLKRCGIRDTEDLLEACATPAGLEALALKADIPSDTVRQLANRANLVRIRGIGEAYTVLLESVGVQTMADLAGQCPEDLRAMLNRVNGELKLVGRVPALAMVNGWVLKAQRLSYTDAQPTRITWGRNHPDIHPVV